MPVRVVHVVAGIGRADGGPSYTVPRLCRALVEVRRSADASFGRYTCRIKTRRLRAER